MNRPRNPHGIKQSEVLANSTYRRLRRRSALLSGTFGLAFFALAARAFWVQCVNDGFYQLQGDIRQIRDFTIHAARGRVLDRNGNVLAMSLPTRALWVDARDVPSARHPPRQRPQLGLRLGFARSAPFALCPLPFAFSPNFRLRRCSPPLRPHIHSFRLTSLFLGIPKKVAAYVFCGYNKYDSSCVRSGEARCDVQ